MNFIASFYSYSITSSIYDLFHTPINNFFSGGVVFRIGIVATIIFSFAFMVPCLQRKAISTTSSLASASVIDMKSAISIELSSRDRMIGGEGTTQKIS